MLFEFFKQLTLKNLFVGILAFRSKFITSFIICVSMNMNWRELFVKFIWEFVNFKTFRPTYFARMCYKGFLIRGCTGLELLVSKNSKVSASVGFKKTVKVNLS